MKEQPAAHRAYILVCTDDDCKAGGSPKLVKRLKRCVSDRSLKTEIRVMGCGCLGKCDEGPNVLLEPGHVWYSEAGKGDVENLVAAAQAMAGAGTRVDED